MKLTISFGRSSLMSTRMRSVPTARSTRSAGLRSRGRIRLRRICVKFADDDYWNHPTLKAFHERMDKDGPPFKWSDYEEAWQAYSAFEARERATHFARADGWQHVLQIETDSVVGPWIGEGCLYVCMRKSDLAERRFDRCWTMLQCT